MKTKRFAALFLTLAMLLGISPISVFASGGDDDGDSPQISLISAFVEPDVIEVAIGDTRTEAEIKDSFPDAVSATVNGTAGESVPVTEWSLVYASTADGAFSTAAQAEFYYEPTLAAGYTLSGEAILPSQKVQVGEALSHAPALASTGVQVGDFIVEGGTQGSDYNYANNVLTITGSAPLKISMASGVTITRTDRIVVQNSGAPTAAANITLNIVYINMQGQDNVCAFEIQGASVANITTIGEAPTNLLSGANRAGLEVQNNGALGIASLNISASSTQQLHAIGGGNAAGIGGGNGGTAGNITINSSTGDVHATGGASGAGIGGGNGGAGGTIQIASLVVATSDHTGGASIGGGNGGAGGDITISGGNVSATSDGSGAAIGSGVNGNGASITISGGTVGVTATTGGAGIGGGKNGTGVTVNISGGTVSATSRSLADAIGSGEGGIGATVGISGGTVTATNTGSGNGIGGGITISGGTVTATSTLGEGIGGAFQAPSPGVPFITASSIADRVGENLWSGIIFIGTSGTLYGAPNISLTADTLLPSGSTLVVPNGKTLTVPSGKSLFVPSNTTISLPTTGGIQNDGTIYNYGMIINIDKISGTGSILPQSGNENPVASLFAVSVYLRENGADKQISYNNTTWQTYTGKVILTGTTSQHFVQVQSGTHDILFDNLNVNVLPTTTVCAFEIAGTAVANITLQGTNTLSSSRYKAGLQVQSGATLNITSASSGSLTAKGNDNSAGIGGGDGGAGGNITISGGTVTAESINDAAGIGGGKGGAGGNITISGGTVTANGSFNGAGIGGGDEGAGGVITITNGTVTANGGVTGGAGIGGGNTADGGTILISGGTVTADSGGDGAGIGGGGNTGGMGGAGGNITISGGNITAKSGNEDNPRIAAGAAIGGGASGAGGTISISGGTVTAAAGFVGAGIGGSYDGAGGNVTISGGTVSATGGIIGNGIGGGFQGAPGTLAITGGSITATAGASLDSPIGLINPTALSSKPSIALPTPSTNPFYSVTVLAGDAQSSASARALSEDYAAGTDYVKITMTSATPGIGITPSPALTYNGTQQTQNVVVKLGGANLTQGAYTLSGNTATNAGDYALTVTVPPLGTNGVYDTVAGTNYIGGGGTSTTTYSIAPLSLAGAQVALGAPLVANDTQQTQGVASVMLGGLTLAEGTDYTLSGNTATNAGSYTLTITGMGNYTGTLAVPFTVFETTEEALPYEPNGTLDLEDSLVPSGNTLHINPQSEAQQHQDLAKLREFAQQNGITGTVHFLADITMTDANGGEVQPQDGNTRIRINVPGLTTADTVTVLHIKDDGSVEKITPVYVYNGYVEFFPTSFSVYSVIVHKAGTGTTTSLSPQTGVYA